tara:strand:+ start:1157 stop:2185 length:1029 start_codon:yes stop_codon:yes gene_type:complete
MSITLNRPRGKKNLLGGINKIYLIPYVRYSRSQITVVDEILTAFPATQVFDYHSVNTNYTENVDLEGGSVAWTQSLTIEVPKTKITSTIYEFVKQDYRAIYIDNLSNIRILGLFNGMDCSITNESATDKSGFNGYKVTLTGKESSQAPYIVTLAGLSITIAIKEARGCKDLNAGLKTVYLFAYTKYTRSQIVLSGQELTSFPTTTILDWYSTSANYSESTEVEGGDVKWNQNFTIDLPRMESDSEVYKLMNKDFRAIFIDNLGNIRILGLYNGLQAKVSSTPSSDKASANGYSVSFSGLENNQAYFLDSLAGVGFEILERFNYVFEDGCNFVFENGNNYIFE